MLEHKAFLFDYPQFTCELLPILEHSLTTNDCAQLISFIWDNIGLLSDPYEGEPLTPSWETDFIETADAHQYGDFALTKYYTPLNDIGLGYSWISVKDAIPDNKGLSPILGSVIGSPDNPFDPGKMGSYFQSNMRVQKNFEFLQTITEQKTPEELDKAVGLLMQPFRLQKGLYVTF